MGCDESHFYTCEWAFILSNVEVKEVFDIKRWVDRNVHLGRTAKIWIKRKDSGKYSVRKAERERIIISENWRCPFEEPIHPRDRYGRRIEQLLREYR